MRRTGPLHSFWLAAAFAGLLFAGLLLNWIFNPTRAVLEQLDRTEYQQRAAGVDLTEAIRGRPAAARLG